MITTANGCSGRHTVERWRKAAALAQGVRLRRAPPARYAAHALEQGRLLRREAAPQALLAHDRAMDHPRGRERLQLAGELAPVLPPVLCGLAHQLVHGPLAVLADADSGRCVGEPPPVTCPPACTVHLPRAR